MRGRVRRLFTSVGNLARGLALAGKSAGAVGSPELVAWLTGADTAAAMLPDRVSRPIAQHPTVHRAIRILATSAAQVELETWPAAANRRRGGDEPIRGHWLPALLQQPGAFMQGDQLIEAVIMSLESTGEAFLWHRDVRRGGAGLTERPHEMWLLPSRSVWHDVEGGRLVRWRYYSQDGEVNIPPEDMTFLRYYNPYDALRGLSTLGAAMLEYSGDHRAALYNRSMLDNGGLPPIIFHSDKNWPDTQRASFMVDYENRMQGPRKAGRAFTLPYGVKAEPFKVTHLEMEWLEGRKFSREQILSVFGVPPALAGIQEGGALFENTRERLRFFWHVTMLPKLKYMQSVLTVSILARYEPGTQAFFKVEPILADIAAAEYAEKVKTGTALWSMGFPAAEINDRLELGLRTEGQPHLGVGYLPFSVVPASSTLEAPEEDEEEDPSPLAEEEEEAAALLPAARSRPGYATRAEGERAKKWEGLSNLYGDIARGYGRRLRSWLWALRAEVLRKLNAAEKGLRSNEWAEVRTAVLRKVDDFLWDEAVAEEDLLTISRSAWERSVSRGVDVLKGETGLTFDFDALDPRVISFYSAKEVRIVDVAQSVRDAVGGAVAEGINAGESVKDIAARVRDAFDTQRVRSMRIARTEVSQAFSGGRYVAYGQAGIGKHEWVTSKDVKVRDTHAAQDGEVMVVGEQFSNGCLYPGDPSGDPGEIIDCRCVTAPVVGNEED